jgi:hypothetical protein
MISVSTTLWVIAPHMQTSSGYWQAGQILRLVI